MCIEHFLRLLSSLLTSSGNLHFIFNKLDFEVYSHENLTKQDMISVMLSTARKDHSRYDCFACCILTHGEAQSVYGADGKRVPIRELTKFFTADTCPTLMNKPKLFFIQACQGKDRMEGTEFSCEGGTMGPLARSQPLWKDQ